MEKLIGRQEELKELNSYIDSGKSEFIAVYGRRRVGKTFLIRHLANDDFAFFITGIHGITQKEQLLNFAIAMERYRNGGSLSVPANWLLAFYELSKYLEELPEGRKIIFIDELPWFDTAGSHFINALENFWNSFASLRDDIKLIVCGSATSWMLNNLIHNRGGLHNRLTHYMSLEPFNLHDCELYLKDRGYSFSRKELVNCYMIFGGIPFYLSKLNNAQSFSQNVDRLFFSKKAPMLQEFQDLYRALFNRSDLHIKIVTELSSKGIGLTRKELSTNLNEASNGELSNALAELEAGGFIRIYTPFSNSSNSTGKRNSKYTLYQLMDAYSLFYFKFAHTNNVLDENFWMHTINTPQRNAWAGLAFEMVCLAHIRQIKKALGISGVLTAAYAWRSKKTTPGTQIDMIIDRKDDTISICEMKYCDGIFEVDKEIAANLEQKIQAFVSETETNKSIMTVLITPFGVKKSQYSSCFQNIITLDELFES